MELNREKLKRMFEDTKGNGGSANGGGGGGSLAGYATQAWVNEGFVSIDFFNRLFTVYGPGETSSDPDVVIEPNDLNSTIKNIKAMFGLWTEQYLSALGLNPGGTGSATSLSMLDDVDITTPTNGQALVYNSTSLKWENQTISTVTALANLTDVLLTSVANEDFLKYDSTSQKWINTAMKTINGQSLIGSGDISVGGGASGNYLPLTGGTLTGNLQIYSTGSGWVEGIRMHVSTNGWCGVVMCGTDNTGGSGTSARTWGLHNYDGRLYLVNNGSNTYTYGLDWQNNGNLNLQASNIDIRTGIGNVLRLYSQTNYAAITYYGLNLRTWVAGSNSDGFYFWNAAQDISHQFSETGGISLIATGNVTIGTIGGSGTSAGAGYFSCGPGYSVNSGRYGLRFLVCDQSDAQTGLGQDLVTPTGYRNAYNLCVAGGRSGGGEGYISFVDHAVNSTTYAYLGGFVNNGGVKFQVMGAIYATGEITALSDVRYKDIQEYMTLDNDAVANAPVISFLWKDRKNNDGLHVGSIAQYWEKVLPEAVKRDKEGTLSMSYGVVALVAAISTAKKVRELDERVTKLEKTER